MKGVSMNVAPYADILWAKHTLLHKDDLLRWMGYSYRPIQVHFKF